MKYLSSQYLKHIFQKLKEMVHINIHSKYIFSKFKINYQSKMIYKYIYISPLLGTMSILVFFQHNFHNKVSYSLRYQIFNKSQNKKLIKLIILSFLKFIIQKIIDLILNMYFFLEKSLNSVTRFELNLIDINQFYYKSTIKYKQVLANS